IRARGGAEHSWRTVPLVLLDPALHDLRHPWRVDERQQSARTPRDGRAHRVADPHDGDLGIVQHPSPQRLGRGDALEATLIGVPGDAGDAGRLAGGGTGRLLRQVGQRELDRDDHRDHEQGCVEDQLDRAGPPFTPCPRPHDSQAPWISPPISLALLPIAPVRMPATRTQMPTRIAARTTHSTAEAPRSRRWARATRAWIRVTRSPSAGWNMRLLLLD